MSNFICLDTKRNKCCVFHTELSFTELKKFIAKYGKVSHMQLPGYFSATNWMGRDDLERTLGCEKLSLTDKSIEYYGKYKGVDNDMGHVYPFTFFFDKIILCKRAKSFEI